MADFVHLHVHSDFSLADAAVSVMKFADRAEELGMSHLALTDHGNMFGAMDNPFIFPVARRCGSGRFTRRSLRITGRYFSIMEEYERAKVSDTVESSGDYCLLLFWR